MTNGNEADDEVDFDVPSDTGPWTCCAKEVPATELVYLSQMITVFLVIVACIVNLSIQNEPHDLWVALLSSSLGYILPAPAMSKKNI